MSPDNGPMDSLTMLDGIKAADGNEAFQSLFKEHLWTAFAKGTLHVNKLFTYTIENRYYYELTICIVTARSKLSWLTL